MTDALKRIRQLKNLGDNPLLQLHLVRDHVRRTGAANTPETAEWALQAVLRGLIEEQLRTLRAEIGAEAEAPSIRSDFSVDSEELERWSSMWHVYLSPERRAIADLVKAALSSPPTFYRRRVQGVERLTDLLRTRELAASREDARSQARPFAERVSVLAPPAQPLRPVGDAPPPPTAAPPPPEAIADDRAVALDLLRTALRDDEAEARLSPQQVAAIGAHVADLEEYRLWRIAEWSRPQHRLDTRFVSLSLLVDQGEASPGRRWRREEARYDSLGAVLQSVDAPALVVLGAPGAGKSTLLRRHELDAAEKALRAGSDASASRHPITYFAPLGRYAADHPGEAPPDPGAWLGSTWAARHPALPPFDALLAEGRLLLLLDALNEMPHRSPAEYRELVRHWKDFLLRAIDIHPGNRFIFSCRSLDYGAPLSTPELRVPQVHVEPLSADRIRAFLERHLPQPQADEVRSVLEAREDPGVFRTPYFLKLLCDQVAESGRVPQGGAGLLTGYVRQALVREIERDTPELRPDGLVTQRDYERAPHMHAARDPFALPSGGTLFPSLADLAFQMQRAHAAGAGAQVRVSYDEAVAILGGADAERILSAGAALGILDEERADDELFFLHQLLQEYFAARRLHSALDPELLRAPWRADEVQPPLADTLAALGPAEPLPPLSSTGWEETALMATAMADNPERFVDEVATANLPLAGRCAAAPEAELTEPARERLRWALVGRMEDPEADLRARLAAAHALGPLGDPRFERREGPHGPYLRPPMVEIPGGTYPIGIDDPDFPQCGPAHTVELAPFAIGRFPVTNAEYALFMRAGGYEDERWWPTEAARAWRQGEGTAEPARERERELRRRFLAQPGLLDAWYEQGMAHQHLYELWKVRLAMSEAVFEAELESRTKGGRKTKPGYWHDAFYGGLSNQPVTGVCRFEALAYCTWLNSQGDTHFRLPSEVEWEAAARGFADAGFDRPPTMNAVAGSYPRNANEARLKQPSPVGAFPLSATSRGVMDLGGNVFELTSTVWGARAEEPDHLYPYDSSDGRERSEEGSTPLHVARGSGYADRREEIVPFYRLGVLPGHRASDAGFRLAQ